MILTSTVELQTDATDMMNFMFCAKPILYYPVMGPAVCLVSYYWPPTNFVWLTNNTKYATAISGNCCVYRDVKREWARPQRHSGRQLKLPIRDGAQLTAFQAAVGPQVLPCYVTWGRSCLTRYERKVAKMHLLLCYACQSASVCLSVWILLK
jgi:hypothetical protein